MAEAFDELLRRARGHPQDLDGWRALAAAVTRSAPAAFQARLEPASDLAPLLRAARAAPGDHRLTPLVLAALGMCPWRDAPAPGRWWVEADRLAEDPRGLHDPQSGLPIYARRLLDDAPVALVAGGAFSRRVPGRRPRQVELEPATARLAYLDVYPVTAGRFARFVEATGHPPPAVDWDLQRAKPHRPVVGVTHADARAYATFVGATLPGRDEWERGARGEEAQQFPWGDEVPSARGPRRAVFRWGVGRQVVPSGWDRFLQAVGSRPEGVSPFGLQGMAGNVSEWCAASPDDPLVPGELGRRRGAWRSAWSDLPLMRHLYFDPFKGRPDLGFRLAHLLDEVA